MPKAAGVLNIISGAIHLFGAIIVLVFGWLGDGVFNILWYGMLGTPLQPLVQPVPQELQGTIAIPVTILGIIAIASGAYEIKRKAWRLALVCSVCGAILTWFLGLPAIILTIISKKDFEQASFHNAS